MTPLPPAIRATLAFCAFCPNPCRSAVESHVPETELPSALAMLAVLANDGHLPLDAEMRAALSRLTVARRCRERCPYDIDTAGNVALLTGGDAGEAGSHG